MMDSKEVLAIKVDFTMSTSQKVWKLFFSGMPCSWIDDVLELPEGTAKREVMYRWSWE